MFVTLRKYRKLERAYEVSQTALITARTERDEARAALGRALLTVEDTESRAFNAIDAVHQRMRGTITEALTLNAQSLKLVAGQAAEAAAAKVVDLIPKPAPVAEPLVGESHTAQKLALSPALNAICENYGFGDPKQTAANRRFALRLLALGKAEGEITQRIVGGAYFIPEEVTA